MILCASSDLDLSGRALALLKPEDGPEALALLEGALSHPSRSIHEVALRTLSRKPSPAAWKVLDRYEHTATEWARRRRLASAIGTLSENTPASADKEMARQILLRLAQDKNPLVAEEARHSLKSEQ
jgi:hypothetical protein